MEFFVSAVINLDMMFINLQVFDGVVDWPDLMLQVVLFPASTGNSLCMNQLQQSSVQNSEIEVLNQLQH